MRIGLDAKRAFHNSRGLGNYSRNLIKGLDLYGDDIDSLLCYGPKPNKKFFNVNNNLSEKVKVISPQGLSSYLPALWRSLFLAERADHDAIDIYHGLSHELPFGIEKYKYKKVVTIHDLTFYKYPEFFNFIDRQIYLQKYRYSCEVADKIIAIGEQTKKDLIECFHLAPEKIEVIYQSVHPRFFIEENHAHKFEDEPYILYVGALDKHKNLQGLIAGFKKAHEQMKEKLLIITRGGSEHDFIKKTLSSKLGAHIKVLTNVDNNSIAPYLAKASAVIFPSFHEGFGLPVMESFATKTPVALSDISVFHEVAGSLGSYFDPQNPEQIAAAILEAVSYKENIEYKAKLFARAQDFSLENCSHILLRFYRDLLLKSH
jgi:glycosyltransferase involved in cell wall biosynthesis